jgi:O-antigen ligase
VTVADHDVTTAQVDGSARASRSEKLLQGLPLALGALTAALGPAYVVRWHLGFYPTTLLETSLLVTLAVFILDTIRNGRTLEWRSALTLPAALFMLAGCASVLAAPSRTAALGIFRAYLVEPAAFAVMLITMLKTPRQAHAIIAGFWAGGIVLAVANSATVLHAIFAHRFNVSSAPPVAIYTAANAVALYLVPLIAVAGSLVLYGSGRALRVTSAVFLAIAVPSVILTFSRGGWATLVAVTAGLALTHRRRLWLVGGLLATGVALVSIPAIRHRIALDLRFDSGETFSGRLGIWSDSIAMLRHRPLFGAGLSGFAQRMGPAWTTKHQIVVIFPHNIVLNFWSETGLLGLIAFAGIFIVTAVTAWRGFRSGDAGWRPIHLGVLLALLAVLGHGLVDVPYFKNDLSLEFWALIALSWAGRRWGSGEPAAPPAYFEASEPRHSSAVAGAATSAVAHELPASGP